MCTQYTPIPSTWWTRAHFVSKLKDQKHVWPFYLQYTSFNLPFTRLSLESQRLVYKAVSTFGLNSEVREGNTGGTLSGHIPKLPLQGAVDMLALHKRLLLNPRWLQFWAQALFFCKCPNVLQNLVAMWMRLQVNCPPIAEKQRSFSIHSWEVSKAQKHRNTW